MARMKLFTRPTKAAAAPVKNAPKKKAEEQRQAGPGCPGLARSWRGHGAARPVREGIPGNNGAGLRAMAVFLRGVLAHDRRPARTPRGNPGHGLL
jgi:hypothetical protein